MNRLTNEFVLSHIESGFHLDDEHIKFVKAKLEYADKMKAIEEQLGCPLEVREKALSSFYIPGYGYVSNNDDFINLRKHSKGYYLKVVIHPSKPTPPHFYGYCDIHYLKDYKKTWWLKEDRSE